VDTRCRVNRLVLARVFDPTVRGGLLDGRSERCGTHHDEWTDCHSRNQTESGYRCRTTGLHCPMSERNKKCDDPHLEFGHTEGGQPDVDPDSGRQNCPEHRGNNHNDERQTDCNGQ